MGTKRILLVAILAALLLGGIYGYKEYNRGVESTAAQESSAALPAAELVQAFVADENAANTSYVGQVVEVKGTVLRVEGNTVVLSAGPDAEVSCMFSEVPTTATGSAMTIKGECAGFDGLIGAQVQLVRCALVE